jgi:hypothetical protein
MVRRYREQALDEERVHRLDVGVSLAAFNGLLPTAEARRLLGLDTAGPLVGALIPLAEPAVVYELLTAWQALAHAQPTCRFLLAGDGPMFTTIKRRLGELGLAGRATLLRRGIDRRAAIKAADVLVDVSREPQGLSLVRLEARAAGTPVVAMPPVRWDGLTEAASPALQVSAQVIEALTRGRAEEPQAAPDPRGEAAFRARHVALQVAAIWQQLVNDRRVPIPAEMASKPGGRLVLRPETG